MDKNGDALKRLSELDDAQLRALIDGIGRAAGAEKRAVELLAGDLDKVREAARGLSPEDAERLIDRAGADKAAKIRGALRDALRKDGQPWK